ncbi:NACHT domain-containing protein [Streptomyces sp. NPDC004838]
MPEESGGALADAGAVARAAEDAGTGRAPDLASAGTPLRPALSELYEAVGEPSLDGLVLAAAREGRAVSRTALHNLLRGKSRPRQDTVESFVVGCVAHARTRRPRIALPPEAGDLDIWRARHRAARTQGQGRAAPESGTADGRPQAAVPPPVVPRPPLALTLAEHFAGVLERAGVPHYLPLGLDPAALDQPRTVRPVPSARARDSEYPVSWAKAVAEHPRVMLLADAGLGKSWLLRMQVHRAARELIARHKRADGPAGGDGRRGPYGQSAGDGSPADPEPLPVLLRCGELAARGEPALAEAVAGHLAGVGAIEEGDRAELVAELKAGRLVLLLDAYDELPGSAARTAFHQVMATASPLLRAVVAARRAGYTGPPPTGGGPAWKELLLDPFGPEETRAVVAVWPLTPEARDSVRSRAASPGLAGLGNVPLLLALLCALAEEVPTGGGAPELPSSKGELYERMLRRFLVHEQRPPAADDTEADRLLGILAPVAHHFATRPEGWADVMPRGAVLRAVRSAGPSFTELRQDAAGVLRTLSVEAGVLQPLGDPSGGREQPYLFAHRSFAEYLTARHLTDLPEQEALAEVDRHTGGGADAARWEDTLAMLGRLTLVFEGQARFERLLDHLLAPHPRATGDPDAADDFAGVLHAVRMLGDLGGEGEPSGPLRERLLARFGAVLRAEPEQAVRAVAAGRMLPDWLVDALMEPLSADADRFAGHAQALAHHPQPSVTRFLGAVAEGGDGAFQSGEAVSALTHRPGRASLNHLLAVFRHVGWPVYTAEWGIPHESAVDALKARRDPAALAPMLAAAREGPAVLGHHDWMGYRIRRGALSVLGGYPEEKATEALLAATWDDNPNIREVALRGLAGRDTPEVRAAVLAGMNERADESVYVRSEARSTAAGLGMSVVPEAEVRAAMKAEQADQAAREAGAGAEDTDGDTDGR